MFPGITEVYLDGEFVAPEVARVSVFDRGFIFGDAIYEVIAAYGGRPFRLEQHLARLDRNLSTVKIRNPLADDEWCEVLDRMLAARPGVDQYLYIEVTRGIAPRNHAFPAEASPTVFAYASEFQHVPESLLADGVGAILRPDIRWHRCDLKTTSLIASAWLRQQASEEGAEEAILVRDGVVSEGAASNVFIVVDSRILTPPNGPDLLPGITRNLLIELMVGNGLEFTEDAFSDKVLLAADEVWITSTTREILPVVWINDTKIGDGSPGPVFTRVNSLLQAYKDVIRDRNPARNGG
jgi:D-alanine transaminase